MSSWIMRRATPHDWPKLAALLAMADLPLVGAEAHLSDFFLAFRDDFLLNVRGGKDSYVYFYRVFACCAIVSQPETAGQSPLFPEQSGPGRPSKPISNGRRWKRPRAAVAGAHCRAEPGARGSRSLCIVPQAGQAAADA